MAGLLLLTGCGSPQDTPHAANRTKPGAAPGQLGGHRTVTVRFDTACFESVAVGVARSFRMEVVPFGPNAPGAGRPHAGRAVRDRDPREPR